MDRRASRWRGNGVRVGPTLRVMGVLKRWLWLGVRSVSGEGIWIGGGVPGQTVLASLRWGR